MGCHAKVVVVKTVAFKTWLRSKLVEFREEAKKDTKYNNGHGIRAGKRRSTVTRPEAREDEGATSDPEVAEPLASNLPVPNVQEAFVQTGLRIGGPIEFPMIQEIQGISNQLTMII